jgi:hypothetical protein
VAKAPDNIKQRNQDLADPNKELVFRGVLEMPYLERTGEDAMYMRVLFSDEVKINEWNPRKSIEGRKQIAYRWGSLCEALGLDWNNLPASPDDWELFIQNFRTFTFPKRGTLVYAKLTIGEEGWLKLGTGRAFSSNPDMEFSDEDTEFLKIDKMDVKMKVDNPW